MRKFNINAVPIRLGHNLLCILLLDCLCHGLAPKSKKFVVYALFDAQVQVNLHRRLNVTL